MNKDLVVINEQILNLLSVSQNLTGTIVRHDEMLASHSKEIVELKQFKDETWTINTYQQFELKEKAHSHIADLVRNQYGSELSKREFNSYFGPLVRQLWKEFKPSFQVPRYSMTRVKDFDRAVDWVEHWTPIKLAVGKADIHRKEAFAALIEAHNEVAVAAK